MKIISHVFIGENEGFANFLKNENLMLRYLNMKYSVFITPLMDLFRTLETSGSVTLNL